MISLEEFVKETEGSFVDFDGRFGPQCVDLIRLYIEKVLPGYPQLPPVMGAADVWKNYPATHFERIRRGPNNAPLPGDIVIWSRSFGPAGHIAIALQGIPGKQVVCLSQNYPTGKPTAVKEFKSYSYRAIYGWLHPRAAQ